MKRSTTTLGIVLFAGIAGLTFASGSPANFPRQADSELVIIPEDWRSRLSFPDRFPSIDTESAPRIDLAAMRFATAGLSAPVRQGSREFSPPDLRSFARALVREPFALADSELFVVQASSPQAQVALRDQLQRLGVSIKGSVPRFAYLVQLSRDQRQALADRPDVFWMGLYQPAWRVSPKLDFIIETRPEQELIMTALFTPEAFSDPSAVTAALRAKSLTVLDATRRRRGWKVRVRGKAIDARRLTRMPTCLWIERFAGYRLDNNLARTSTPTATGRGDGAGPLMDVVDVWARGLRGEGQIAAASDTGLSTGDLATIHPDFGLQGSPTNPPRIVAAYALGRSTWDDDQSIPGAGHGTHVAGSIVGNGVRSGAQPSFDVFPPSSYAGTAPKARLVFQSILDAAGGFGGLPADLNSLFQTPYDDGARVHSNSWSAPADGQYSAESQEVDEFVWNHPDMVITYSAGDRGDDGRIRMGSSCLAKSDPIDGVVDTDGIGAPGTAKNNITVGASENYRPSFVFESPGGDCDSADGIEQKTWGWFDDCRFSFDPIFSDPMADKASGLSALSSRGPTDDGRFKPDLVAPGIAVISTRTDQNQAYQPWGVCNVPELLRPYYVALGGTSMANALTAGAATLVRQYYSDGWHGEGNPFTNLYPVPGQAFNPTAALVKATLINGAWDMAPGQYGSGSTQELPPDWDSGFDLPNNAEGFGRVDLEASLFPGSGFGRDPGRDLEVHYTNPGLQTGQFHDYDVVVASAADPLIVTLVWTDPYAVVGSGSQLVNDLNLTVTSPSTTVYLPNGVDRTTGAPDSLNNVEQVKVTSPAAGSWSVRVAGFNVPGNGEPGTATQPYALVISSVSPAPCSQPATPTGLVASPGDTNGIDLSWNPVAADSYSVLRSATPGGPYQRLATGVISPSHSDTLVSGGESYFYVVTAVNAHTCESGASGESSATAPAGVAVPAAGFGGLIALSVLLVVLAVVLRRVRF